MVIQALVCAAMALAFAGLICFILSEAKKIAKNKKHK